ncbi:MFS transporter [Flavobacterium sp.]|uniref:MDR family MFS transporter n=1 Tax=Flavobacterium sp. TaxID=239 RepID=UPI00262F4512|nr:MFS transporter [Flavobacterium sp.]
MLKRQAQKYINTYKGFKREVWILAGITFVNRAGTMVLPFLSKYLKEDLHFSFSQVGWLMTAFGLGSMLGSFLGGKLSDKVGFYNIMTFSLFGSSILFIALQFITSFYALAIGIFILLTVADMFRPAMFVSLGTLATPETRARSFTLVRLAVNLGFAAGPAIGGLLIMNLGYESIFWVDGLTCLSAVLLFLYFIPKPKHEIVPANDTHAHIKRSIPQAKFLWFLLASFGTAVLFFQLFSTLPLYHHDKYGLTEFQTGLLMTMNGLIIFFMEMPVVSYFEKRKTSMLKLMAVGSLLMSSSFLVLIPGWNSNILIISMLFMTFGEMFIFPFSNTFALSISPKHEQGKYMGFFTMSFSLAHICSSKGGLSVVDAYGYSSNWIFMTVIGVASLAVTFYLMRYMKSDVTSR